MIIGGRAEASQMMRRQAAGQPPPPSTFSCDWDIPQPAVLLNVNQTIRYKALGPAPVDPTKPQLKLALLWTKATTGNPDSSNTYKLFDSICMLDFTQSSEYANGFCR